MFELLEELSEPFKKRFKKEVTMTELTRFQVHTHPKAWVIVTTNYVYLMAKKFFFMSVTKVPLKEVTEVSYQGGEFLVYTDNRQHKHPVASNREQTIKQLVVETNKLIG